MVAKKVSLKRPLTAEFLGTFCLSLVVLFTLGTDMGLATPYAAALTVGLIVYLVGPVSGAHVNPAITLGLLGLGKMRPQAAFYYIVFQCVGAVAAVLVAFAVIGPDIMATPDITWQAAVAEACGTLVLAFAVTSVALGRVSPGASGLVVGLGLFIGVLFASTRAAGFLNPAVALSAGAASLPALIGPILGGFVGAQLASYVHDAD